MLLFWAGCFSDDNNHSGGETGAASNQVASDPCSAPTLFDYLDCSTSQLPLIYLNYLDYFIYVHSASIASFCLNCPNYFKPGLKPERGGPNHLILLPYLSEIALMLFWAGCFSDENNHSEGTGPAIGRERDENRAASA